MRMGLRLLSTFLLLSSLSSCLDDSASATFPVGQEFVLNTASIGIPDTLRDGSTVASIPCGPMGMCPSTAEVPVTCEGSICDPAPLTFSVQVGDVIDFEAISTELGELFSDIDSIEILDVEYNIMLNTLTVPVGQLDIFWGPSGAVDVDPAMGTILLGTVPPLAVGEMGMGAVSLDAAGNDALSVHLTSAQPRIKLFVRTSLDLVPGMPFPEGDIQVQVRLTVRVAGSIL